MTPISLSTQPRSALVAARVVRADGGTASCALTCWARPAWVRFACPVTTVMPAAVIPCGRDTAPLVGPALGALTDPPDFALAAAVGAAALCRAAC